jgi:hypothetical protein
MMGSPNQPHGHAVTPHVDQRAHEQVEAIISHAQNHRQKGAPLPIASVACHHQVLNPVIDLVLVKVIDTHVPPFAERPTTPEASEFGRL